MIIEIEKLTQILRDSDNIVFFGGAGVSTEIRIQTHHINYNYKVKFYI